MFLTAVAAAAIAVGARAQGVIQAPAGQAYSIANNASATAVTPVTYQWYRNNSPIQGATEASYTVPAAAAYGDNVTFYRMAKARECGGEAEKPSNTITITFTGYVVPAGCNLVIGGVCWANANIDAPNTFAVQADMYTKFYQWNRLTAYSADDPLDPAWNVTADQSITWTVNPCPQDWRLPSQDEYQQLLDAGSTWAEASTRGNALPGRFYGYNNATCRLPNFMNGCVFFPASGARSNTNGALTSRGASGYGWTSTQVSSTIGYNLTFTSTSSDPAVNHSKAFGFTIRCVK